MLSRALLLNERMALRASWMAERRCTLSTSPMRAKNTQHLEDEMTWATSDGAPAPEPPVEPPVVSEHSQEVIRNEWGATKSKFFMSLDPRLALWKSVIDPQFVFSLPNGDERLYRVELMGHGPQIDCSIRLQAAWFLRVPTAELVYSKPIAFSGGFDFALFGVHITIAKFYRRLGGLFMIGVPLGLAFGATPIKAGYMLPATR
jgi:hypothetical protein